MRACSVVSDSLQPPWTIVHEIPSVHGIFQARIVKWVAISYSRGSSQPRDQNPGLLHLLHWQADSLPWCPWEAQGSYLKKGTAMSYVDGMAEGTAKTHALRREMPWSPPRQGPWAQRGELSRGGRHTGQSEDFGIYTLGERELFAVFWAERGRGLTFQENYSGCGVKTGLKGLRVSPKRPVGRLLQWQEDRLSPVED